MLPHGTVRKIVIQVLVLFPNFSQDHLPVGKKQQAIPVFTAEAEYGALTHVVQEAVSMRHVLKDLGCLEVEATPNHEDFRDSYGSPSNKRHQNSVPLPPSSCQVWISRAHLVPN